MTKAQKEFIKWLMDRGSTGVFVTTKASDDEDWRGGGKVFMAQGDVAHVNMSTIKKLVVAGILIQDGSRRTIREGFKL